MTSLDNSAPVEKKADDESTYPRSEGRTEVNRQVPFGRTGLRVGRLAVGTVNFGGRTEEPEARRILDAALAHGMNLIDTADMYGWRVHRGYTEELIGRWLAGSSRRRDDVVIATKVGEQMGDGPNDRALSAHHIVRGCEASLRRLGTDTIDLYQMHRYDPGVCWDAVWQAMDQLVSQGKVRYVGSSNFAGWNIAAAQHAAQQRGMVGLVSEQCLYNLLTREPELEILPAAHAYGLTVLTWSPLHSGLLSGALRKAQDGTGGEVGAGAPRRRWRPIGLRSNGTNSCAPISGGIRPRWVWPGCSRGRTASFR